MARIIRRKKFLVISFLGLVISTVMAMLSFASFSPIMGGIFLVGVMFFGFSYSHGLSEFY